MSARIGLVTIGQTPRTDVVSEIMQLMAVNGIEVIVVERGALDNLSSGEIQRLSPINDDDVLITRLRNGYEVAVSKKHIVPLIQRAIDELVKEDPHLIALLCAGVFPEFNCHIPLLKPDKLLSGVLASLSIKRIGLLVPSPRQVRPIQKQFAALGYEVVGVGVSPYQSSEAVVKTAVEVAKRDVDIIVMDCFGYSSTMKQTIQNVIHKPVLLVRTLLAQVLIELLHYI